LRGGWLVKNAGGGSTCRGRANALTEEPRQPFVFSNLVAGGHRRQLGDEISAIDDQHRGPLLD